MINYPSKLNIIFDKLKNYGIKPIIVGGFVRDSLLKIESKDIDIEVYGDISFKKLEEILKEFGNVNIVGKSFGVCKLKFEDYDLDFSLPRIDNKIESGHRGFDVKVDSNLDFKTAASRRDFTINAIGYDVTERTVLDPFCGIDDLRDKILRAVNLKSFIEDPLRVLRAAQFCARFNLKIEDNLFFTCKDMVSKNLLDELPKERVFEEIKKLLLKSQKPSYGFKLLKEFGTDIYTDNISVIDETVKRLTTNNQTNLVLMLAGLCYNFELTQTENFILKLTDEKELLKRVINLIQANNEIDKIYNDADDYLLYKLAAKVNIDELLILSNSIYFAKNSSNTYKVGEEIYKRAKELNVLKGKLPPLLMGRDILELGLKPSPKFSQILDDAYEAQMHGKFKNHGEALLWLKEHIKALNCQSL
ncbi:MAG: CCA tRNA nucleotidyltransferase [Sulfurimonas sp.]|uniref:CCA tRNA nucleotidyltransferase n=1 Tax=Sulfurimonas sp. TaxID=2022749 RepID=UPI002636D5C7|nr:CCA tRNA nucleotidyltransferase [Sulfurimonas sp.]MDD5373502.1 CCA tRNA nucleotidyltransferase [Sulfurimonas sp.]